MRRAYSGSNSRYLGSAIACAGVGFANLVQHRLRLAAALTGVAVALFLLLLQIAILNAAREKVTQLFEDFRFDLAIVPDTYQFLLSFDTMDRAVLDVARATGAVSGTYGLNVDVVPWTQLPSKREAYNFLIGLDDPGSFLRNPLMRRGMGSLSSSHSVLIDAYSLPSIGSVAVGTAANIGDERVEIAGQFKLGLFFYADGGAIVRNTEFARLAKREPGSISMGLLQLYPGRNPIQAKADLIHALPSHTLVLTHDELIHGERAYFLSTKPVGIMIYISMLIACVVSGAIIVQVLSTEISNRMNEFAVLKAMGASPWFVHGIAVVQAAILGLGGLIPAFLIGSAVLQFIEYRTHLECSVGFLLIGTMLVITLFLAAAASSATVGRVNRADPASLF